MLLFTHRLTYSHNLELYCLWWLRTHATFRLQVVVVRVGNGTFPRTDINTPRTFTRWVWGHFPAAMFRIM